LSEDERIWPLRGLRVIDLSTEIAGPYSTKMLADAGADVVKVETREGDPLRRWTASGAKIPTGQDGALFQYLNASKRSLVTDLESRAGREVVLDLSATSDLVVESCGAGEMSRLGLPFEALQARNPFLSLLSISPWGQTGPWAQRPATEWTLQAASGSTAGRGLPERGPVAFGGRIGEWIAGIYAALGAVCAWLSARSTGSGQHVDLSMFEAMVTAMPCFGDLHGQLLELPLVQRIELPGVEPAKDGWVGFCTNTGQQFKDLFTLVGRPDVGEDKRFSDFTFRMAHVNLIHEIVHAYTRQHTVDEIIEAATPWRIPSSPIGNGQNLPQMDHLVERGVFVQNPAGFLQPRIPYRLEKTPLRPLGPAPRLGEHTAEVLAEPARARPSLSPGERKPALPLAGLRVIDLTAFWAGPIAMAFLADMGADVVKVESIQRPDGMRFATMVRNDPLWEWSPVFLGANTGKRDVTLKLDSEAGLALLKRLIASADILTESFSVRVMEHFGLTWEVVQSLNPHLIMLRMPAYGLDGPWRDRPGFAANVEQASGLAWITGYADQPLILNVCDVVGGMHAVFALLMALEHRRRTGEGQLVEATLLEPALNVAAEQVIEYSAYGELLMRSGNRGPYAAPQGVYACANRAELLALAVATDEQWGALCSLMGDPVWARDPAFATASGRRAAHDAVDDRLRAWLAELDRDEAVEKLVGAGVPAHALINGHYLMPNPQLEHRQFFQILEHPYTGKKRYPGLPLRFSALGPHLHRSPPPTLGQHNDEILGGELGLSGEELARLREKKVIGERPAFDVP
jgi:crotonobetainyl-CoA:carnitine CoA-transferase CaiB-like acyl-CoA transferase